MLFALIPALHLATYSVRDPNHGLAMALLWSLSYERILICIGIALCGLGIALHGWPGWRISVLFLLGATISLSASFVSLGSLWLHVAGSAFGGVLLVFASLLHRDAKRCGVDDSPAQILGSVSPSQISRQT